jgi:uncharacterized membrane protein YccC
MTTRLSILFAIALVVTAILAFKIGDLNLRWAFLSVVLLAEIAIVYLYHRSLPEKEKRGFWTRGLISAAVIITIILIYHLFIAK